MTILPDLKDELAEAATRAARRRSARRHTAKIAAFAVGGVLALGGAAVAADVAGIWRPTDQELGGLHLKVSGATPPKAQLDALGILRRPQTAVDREYAVKALRAFGRPPGGSAAHGPLSGARVRTNYVRTLHVYPDGRAIVLIPVDKSPLQLPLDRTHHDPKNPYWPFKPRPRGDALCTVTMMAGPTGTVTGFGIGCSQLADVLDGHAGGGTGRDRYFLVPDGVKTVRVWLAGDHAPLDVPVRDNVAFVVPPRGVRLAGWSTWLDASGQPVGPRCDARPATCARIARRHAHQLERWGQRPGP